MRKSGEESLGQSAAQVFRRFWAVLQSANSLVPGATFVGTAIALGAVLLISANTGWRTAATAIVVLVVAVVIFIRRRRFGEAAIALVAGLFPALSTTWTNGLFIAFCTAWIALASIALIIDSVGLAAQVQSIFTAAAVPLRAPASPDPAKDLQRIASAYSGLVGPVEKAKILRILSYRGLPISAMAEGLRAVDQLSAVLELEHHTAAGLVADIYRMESGFPAGYLDTILAAVRRSGSSPTQFVDAFERSRHAALGGETTLNDFANQIADKLLKGLSSDQIGRSWK